MTDILIRAYTSRAVLYARFDLDAQDAKTARKMFGEEAIELVEASSSVQALTAKPYHPADEFTREHLLEEAADVLYTSLGLVQAHGFTLADLEAAVEAKCAKNDKKDSTTHMLLNGKITRRA